MIVLDGYKIKVVGGRITYNITWDKSKVSEPLITSKKESKRVSK